MKALIQRVSEARVLVADEIVGEIGQGLLVLLGVEKHDTRSAAQKLAERVIGYRVFADDADKMNLDVRDIQGSLLVVSQFTLAADTRKGRRPSFSSAGTPEQALELYEHFCQHAALAGVEVQTGRFAANMQVHLVNDGPVTFELTA